MSEYKITLSRSAAKEYASIRNIKLLRGINRILDDIKKDPGQYKKLSGPLAHLRSARTFSFRILYEVRERELLVYVVSIDDRKDVYR
ncbi:MAG: type II toxin-antitoxin system RelE family toxin [Candidatus Omnitrophota bacterium]